MGANIAANVFSLRAYKPLSVPRFLVLILEPYTHAVYLEPVSDVVDGFKNCFVGGVMVFEILFPVPSGPSSWTCAQLGPFAAVRGEGSFPVTTITVSAVCIHSSSA